MSVTEALRVELANDYPRWACPECGGPVEAVVVTCDLDEDHERWNCLDPECDAWDDMAEDDLKWITEAPAGYTPPDPILDPAALLKAGKVLPSYREWVSKKVAP
jgi:hypothetical protein